MTGNQPGLRRVMRPHQATAMVVGTIIGASIFVQPSEVTSQVPTLWGTFLVWAVCGALTLCGALVCANWASRCTRSGGLYVYLLEAFPPYISFLWGWSMFWVTHSGITAAVAVIFARYLSYFVPLDDGGVRVAAVLLILLLSGINFVGVQYGSGIQALFTYGKLAVIGVMVVASFLLGSSSVTTEAVEVHPVGWDLSSFSLAVIAGLFAFGGWHMVTHNSEETVYPERTIPRALVLGTLIVTFCYIALNAAYLYVLPLETVVTSQRVAADAADAVLGSGGGALMSGLVLFSTFGALTGIILAGPRVYYAMARDGMLFPWLGHVHPSFQTPHWAIVFQAVWASVLVFTGTYQALFRRVIYTEWIFFGLMAVGLFLVRDSRSTKGSFGYPFAPGLFAVAAFAIVAQHVVALPGESAAGLAIVLTGLAVYYFWVRPRAYRRR